MLTKSDRPPFSIKPHSHSKFARIGASQGTNRARFALASCLRSPSPGFNHNQGNCPRRRHRTTEPSISMADQEWLLLVSEAKIIRHQTLTLELTRTMFVMCHHMHLFDLNVQRIGNGPRYEY